MPSSLQALSTRSAISPRLATSTLRNIDSLESEVGGVSGLASQQVGVARTPDSVCTPRSGTDRVQRLDEFDGLAVVDEALQDLAGGVGLDLVHQLHGLDDTDDLAFGDVIAGRDK